MNIEFLYQLNKEIIDVYFYVGIACLSCILITSYIVDMINSFKEAVDELYDYYYH